MLGWNEIPEMVNLTRNNVYTTPILAHTHTRGVKANTINDFSKERDSQLPGIFYHVFPQRENWIEASWGTWRLYMPSGNQPWTVAMENLQMEILMGKSSNYKWRNFWLPCLITGGYSSGLFANFPRKNLISIVLAKQWSLKPTIDPRSSGSTGQWLGVGTPRSPDAFGVHIIIVWLWMLRHLDIPPAYLGIEPL